MPPSQCPQCGADNPSRMIFCQNCGHPLAPTADLPPIDYYDPSAADPYGTAPNQPQPQPYAPPPPYYPPAPAPYAQIVYAYRCPYCGSPYPPQIVRRLSGAGWVILIVGIFFCLVGALAALACMEDQRYCATCGARVG